MVPLKWVGNGAILWNFEQTAVRCGRARESLEDAISPAPAVAILQTQPLAGGGLFGVFELGFAPDRRR